PARTHGWGKRRKEMKLHRRRARPEQEREDQEQRHHPQPGGGGGQPGHHDVEGAARSRRHSRIALTGPPTDHTSRRASALTTTVTTKSKRPISISAAR